MLAYNLTRLDSRDIFCGIEYHLLVVLYYMNTSFAEPELTSATILSLGSSRKSDRKVPTLRLAVRLYLRFREVFRRQT